MRLFSDLVSWLFHLPRKLKDLPNSKKCSILPYDVPFDGITRYVTLHWVSTGNRYTRIYKNGQLEKAFTPSAGVNNYVVSLLKNEVATFDVIETLLEDTAVTPQPNENVNATIEFTGEPGAYYRIYATNKTYDVVNTCWADCEATSSNVSKTLSVALPVYGLCNVYDFSIEKITDSAAYPVDHISMQIFKRPAAPIIKTTKTENGIEIETEILDVPTGVNPHTVTVTIYDGRDPIRFVTLSKARPKANITIGSGTYRIITTQSGGPWHTIFDRERRIITI